MTEVVAQDDTVTFKQNNASFSAFTYAKGWLVLITHSWGAAFTISEKSSNIIDITYWTVYKYSSNILNILQS